MSDQEKVVNCYREMYRGMIDKNRNTLSEVLDDSFVLVHMTGMRQSKEAVIPFEGYMDCYHSVPSAE